MNALAAPADVPPANVPVLSAPSQHMANALAVLRERERGHRPMNRQERRDARRARRRRGKGWTR